MMLRRPEDHPPAMGASFLDAAGEPGVDSVSVRKAGRDVAGEVVDLTRRVSERTCRYPHSPTQGHRLDRRGFRDAATLVAMDHLEAPLVQKALEEQPV